jgi:hypothetical protein
MRRLTFALCALILCAACSEPPQKEIDQAQGALDAARAAGAEQYAAGEFSAASTALQLAQEAVQQRDYRLALSRALDARERAQEAAKQAADGKARARSEAETAIGAASAALLQLRGKIGAAESARVPARELASARDALSAAQAELQESRAEVKKGDYLQAGTIVRGTREKILAQIGEVDRAINARASKPARRRR